MCLHTMQNTHYSFDYHKCKYSNLQHEESLINIDDINVWCNMERTFVKSLHSPFVTIKT